MKALTVLIPVYNDWESLQTLLEKLEQVAAGRNLSMHVVIVDDSSTLPRPQWDLKNYRHVASLQVVNLVRNLGNQRAIAMGLAVLDKKHANGPVIVMDGDGEDKPEDIPALLDAHAGDNSAIIFARRSRRSEGRIFRTFYFFFKMFFGVLTGNRIAFGNFCLIPAGQLQRVAHLQELWNHFAAGIMHSSVPWKTIPTERGKRYSGSSHMNLISLVLHGLSAISVHIEFVYARLLFLAFGLILLDIAGFLALLYIRFGTSLAIPGWATTVAIGLTVVMVQAVIFLALLSFVVLSYRSSKMFIPAVDYKDYLLQVEKVK
jgi:hypothetical protein